MYTEVIGVEPLQRPEQGAPRPATRLLLVDDEEPNRDVLARRLQRRGYEVEVASSGPEAITALTDRPFDAMLLDVQMPGMSGIELLGHVRQRFSPTQLPIIMVTARSQSEDVVEALDLGANDYITKPVDLAVALARIRTHVGLKQAEQALADSEERYALAVRGSRDGLWDWRIETGEVYYSPRWNEILGYPAEQAIDGLERWLSRVHADDVGRVRAEIDEHLGGRTSSFEIEHRIRHHSAGHYRWVLARGAAMRAADGRPIRMAGSVSDITEGKVADALTDLPNRVLFMDRLGRLIDYRHRHGGIEFAVMFVDLDRFKNVNDTLGHDAGDELLIHVARRLEQGLREKRDSIAHAAPVGPAVPSIAGETLLARLSGDEFAVLLTGVREVADAVVVAERFAALLADPIQVAGQEMFTSASIGIALSTTSAGFAADMLRDADTALYRAKAAGRGRHKVFDHAMREQVVRRAQLEAELRRAIERQDFVVHYQPIVSVPDRTVTSLEAIVRWRHPQRGLLGAEEFAPMAEDTGLVVALGYWVFDEVCRQMAVWSTNTASKPRFTVAVNVSALQLAQPDLPERFAKIASRHGVSTNSVEIEITERSVTADLDRVQAVVARLKVLGFRLSIDCFGASHSSFTYLQRLQVDRLKIDPSFMASNSGAWPMARDILGTVVSLARHLDLEVVAEGVETPEQLEHLRRIDCGFGQGCVFREPVAADLVSGLLRPATVHPEKDPAVAATHDMATILLVEDNENNADLLHRWLTRRGFHVVSATDGLQAVERSRDDSPDLILMDVNLPEIDGWEATRRIRENPATATIPVIALTAHAMASDRDRSLVAGCDEFMTKPIDIQQLLQKIDTLLDRRIRRG